MNKTLLTSVLLLSSLAFAKVTVTAKLVDGQGNVSRTAYLHWELWNCGANRPLVSGQTQTIVATSFDAKPNPATGVITRQVIANDQILCGGIASTEWSIQPMADPNTPIGPALRYFLRDADGPQDFSAMQPTTQDPVLPGWRLLFGNPVATQTWTQPAGTEADLWGLFYLNGVLLNGGGSGCTPNCVVTNPTADQTIAGDYALQSVGSAGGIARQYVFGTAGQVAAIGAGGNYSAAVSASDSGSTIRAVGPDGNLFSVLCQSGFCLQSFELGAQDWGVNFVPFSTTPTVDLFLGNVAQFNCSTPSSVITPSFTDIAGGGYLIFSFQQNASAACSVSWPSNVVGGVPVDATLAATSTQEFYSWDGVNLYALGGSGGGNPGSPSGSLQGNNSGSFAGIPGTSVDFTNGLLAIAPSGTGVAFTLTGDAHSNNIQNWFVNGGLTPAAFVDRLGVLTAHGLEATGSVVSPEFCIGISCITSWPSGGISGSGTANYFPLWTDTAVQGNSQMQAVTSPNGVKYTTGSGQYFQLDASHLSFNTGIAGASNVVIQNTYAPGSNNQAGGMVLEGAPATGSACAGPAVLQGAGTNGSANGASFNASGGCSNGYGAMGADAYVYGGSTSANNGGGNVHLVPGSGGFAVGNVLVDRGKLSAYAVSTYPGLNVGYFAVAPTTSFANGDVWATSGGLYARIAGATVGPFGTGGGTPYPSGSGIPVVSSGTSWGTTIAASGAKCYPFQGSSGTGCDTPSGAGNVNTSGSPAAHQPAIFSSSTGITGATAGAADAIFMANDAGATGDPAFKSGPSGGTNGCAGSTDTPTYNTSTHAWGCHQITPGTGTVTNTPGNLTSHAVVLGNGTNDEKVLGSLGTTTTVLHGNASGDPSYGAVSLANDVTAQLPIGAVGSTGLSGTSPIQIASTGAISCPTCGTGSGNTTSAPLSTNTVPVANGPHSLVDSHITDDGTTVSIGAGSGPVDIVQNPIATEVANDATTGTTLNLLAKVSTTGAILTATGDSVSSPANVVVAGAGTTGNAQLAEGGVASCVMNNSASNTEGQPVFKSVTGIDGGTPVAGRCYTVSSASASPGWFYVGHMLDNSTTAGSAAKIIAHYTWFSNANVAVGPGSSTANHLAKFSGTDGKTLADGGAIPASFTASGNTTVAATAASNVAGAATGIVVTTDGGGNVQSSGTLLSSLAGSSSYYLSLGYNNSNFTAVTNHLILSGTVLPSLTSIGHIVVSVGTLDGTHNSDECIYTKAGTLAAHVGAQTAGFSATGSNSIAISGGAVNLPAGAYYVGFTSAASTLVLTASAGSVSTFYPIADTTISTTGGACPSSITPPADSWVIPSGKIQAFGLAP